VPYESLHIPPFKSLLTGNIHHLLYREDAKEQTLLIKIGYKKQTTLSRWITHFYSFEFGKKVVLSSIFSETTELALTIQLEPINFPGINEQ